MLIEGREWKGGNYINMPKPPKKAAISSYTLGSKELCIVAGR